MVRVSFASVRVPMRELPLLLAIFLDLVGFGMAFMDIQLRAQESGATWWMIGGLLSSYSIVQLIVSPWWGRLSDRVGRKPVLIVCTSLSALSMLVYAFVPSLWGILLSRILAGFAAANVVAGQAYIADITSPESRSAAMGRVSAAILLGLIVGPGLGGWLADQYGSSGMALWACAASTLSLAWIVFGVEHRPPNAAHRAYQRRYVFDFQLINAVPELRRILGVAVAGWFVLACLEGTFARLLSHTLGSGRFEPGLVFSYESLLGAGIGLLMGSIASRFAPSIILRLGYVLQGVGVALMPLAPNMGFILVASSLYALGIGMANPTINAVCSELTPENRQGELFGLMQASRAVGFIVGPTLGAWMFAVEPGLPYYVAFAVALAAALLVALPKTVDVVRSATGDPSASPREASAP